jgi:hypothetical protein
MPAPYGRVRERRRPGGTFEKATAEEEGVAINFETNPISQFSLQSRETKAMDSSVGRGGEAQRRQRRQSRGAAGSDRQKKQAVVGIYKTWFGDGAGVSVRMQAAYDTWNAERKGMSAGFPPFVLRRRKIALLLAWNFDIP